MQKNQGFELIRLFHDNCIKNQGRAEEARPGCWYIKARNSWRYRINDNNTNIRR